MPQKNEQQISTVEGKACLVAEGHPSARIPRFDADKGIAVVRQLIQKIFIQSKKDTR